VTGSGSATAAVAGFPAAWLRHNCPCPACQDPVTGQRLIDITDIPNECGLTVAAQTAETVDVAFTPDGHRATFSRTWLAEHALPVPQAAGGPGRSPWLTAGRA
jgi:hypothetical protein